MDGEVEEVGVALEEECDSCDDVLLLFSLSRNDNDVILIITVSDELLLLLILMNFLLKSVFVDK